MSYLAPCKGKSFQLDFLKWAQLSITLQMHLSLMVCSNSVQGLEKTKLDLVCRAGGGRMAMGRLLLQRLHVNGHMCLRAEVLFQQMLDICGTAVGMLKGELTIHADVHLDGYMVADAAGA